MSFKINYTDAYHCFVRRTDDSYTICTDVEGEINLVCGKTVVILKSVNGKMYLGNTELVTCTVGSSSFGLCSSTGSVVLTVKSDEYEKAKFIMENEEFSLDLYGYKTNSVSSYLDENYYTCGVSDEIATTNSDAFYRSKIIRNFPVLSTPDYNMCYIFWKELSSGGEFVFQMTSGSWSCKLEFGESRYRGYSSKKTGGCISNSELVRLADDNGTELLQIVKRDGCNILVRLDMRNPGSIFAYKMLSKIKDESTGETEIAVDRYAEFNLKLVICYVLCDKNVPCEFPELMYTGTTALPVFRSIQAIYEKWTGKKVGTSDILYCTRDYVENKGFTSEFFRKLCSDGMLFMKMPVRQYEGDQCNGFLFLFFGKDGKCDMRVYKPVDNPDVKAPEYIELYSRVGISYEIASIGIGKSPSHSNYCIALDNWNVLFTDKGLSGSGCLSMILKYNEGAAFRFMPPQVGFDNKDNSEGDYQYTIYHKYGKDVVMTRYNGYCDAWLVMLIGNGEEREIDDISLGDLPSRETVPDPCYQVDDNIQFDTEPEPEPKRQVDKSVFSLYSNMHSAGSIPADYKDYKDVGSGTVERVCVEYTVDGTRFCDDYTLESDGEDLYVCMLTTNRNSENEYSIEVSMPATLNISEDLVEFTIEVDREKGEYLVYKYGSEVSAGYSDFNYNHVEDTSNVTLEEMKFKTIN